jgi:predicted DNA-binding transcriptional regulator YafY
MARGLREQLCLNRSMVSPNPALRQSAEEVVRLVRAAILQKRPLRVIYDGHERWLCPQMLGRNKAGRARVLCLQR